MENFGPWLVVLGVVALAAVGAGRARRRHGRDRQLMVLCGRAGLRFMPVDPFPDLWLPFRQFGAVDDRGTENAVWDERDDGAVRAFDFWYVESKSDDGAWGTTRRLSCAVVELPFTCPHLAVEPRGHLEALDERISAGELLLELEAFNRRFRIEAADRRFAVAFLDQRMMEAMMGLPAGTSMTVNEDRLLLSAPLLPAPQVLLLLEAARRLRVRMPAVIASLYPPRPMQAPQEARWFQGHWSAGPT
jgi:hypothetical protein